MFRAPIVYGADDRIEALDYPDSTLVATTTELVGALLPRAFVARDGDGWLLTGPALKDEVALCEGERFTEQPRLAVCTALLVAPNAILTAGHCIPPELLSGYLFVRGYHLGGTFPRVAADRVHELEALLSRVDGDLTSASNRDMAIARLRTRSALPSFDLSVRRDPLEPGERVIVVGTSEGLPIKIEDGGTVLATSSSGYFEMTSDTFRGSSGSPVLARDGNLLGMLVGGAADYQRDESAGCYRRLALAAPAARGEIALDVAVLRDALDGALSEASSTSASPGCSGSGAGRDTAGGWAGGALLAAALARRRRRAIRFG